MNVITFTGNLGKDAEVRYAPNGDTIASFSVALSHGYGDKKGTAWLRCSLFGKRAESIAPYLVKGQLVGIVGEFAPREYEKDGQTRMSLDVRVSNVDLLGKRNEDAPAPAQQRQEAQAQPGGFGDFADDIPF